MINIIFNHNHHLYSSIIGSLPDCTDLLTCLDLWFLPVCVVSHVITGKKEQVEIDLMTSWSNMDAKFFPPLDYEPIRDVIESMEPRCSEILRQLESRTPEGVIAEVVKLCDLGQVRNARMSAFRAAMDKVDLCLNQAAILKDRDNEITTEVEIEVIKKADELYRSLKPKDMISRRCVKRMTNDLLELLYFIAGMRVEFPTEMIKTFPSSTNHDSIIDGALHFPFDLSRCDTHFDDSSSNRSSVCISPITSEHILDNLESNTEEELGRFSDADDDEDDHVRDYDNARYADIMVDINNFIGNDNSDEHGTNDDRPGMGPNTHHQKVFSQSPTGLTNPIGLSPQEVMDGHRGNAHRVGRKVENDDPIVNKYADRIMPYDMQNRDLCGRTCPPQPITAPGVPVIVRHTRVLATHTDNRQPDIVTSRTVISQPPKPKLVDKGTFVTEKGIEVEMADRDAWARWPRRRDSSRDRDSCGECSARIDSLEMYRRHAIAQEEVANEAMRKLRIRNAEMADDICELRRRLNDLENARPIIVTTVAPDNINPARLVSIPGMDDNSIYHDPVVPSAIQYDAVRPRSASFNGRKNDQSTVLNHSSDGLTRNGRRENVQKVEVVRASTLPVDHTKRKDPPMKRPPLPQRPPAPPRDPEKRRGRGRGRRHEQKSDTLRKETPLRDWLSSARQPESPTNDSPTPVEVTSPSWADEDPDDPCDQFSEDTSEPPTPDPVTDRRRRPDLRKPDGNRAVAECINIYAMPPSGRVTEDQQPTHRQLNANGAAAATYGGARPKTTKQLGKSGVDGPKEPVPKPKTGGNKPDTQQKQGTKPGGKQRASYSKIVTNSGWKTVANKKRKFDNVSPRMSRPLKGIAATVNREVYLQGLDLEGCVSEDDIVESVKSYCLDNGIKPVYIRIIPVRNDQTRVGCKLTVVEEDFERVVDSEFWPDNISAREWTPRPRDNNGNNNGNNGGGGRQPSDDDD